MNALIHLQRKSRHAMALALAVPLLVACSSDDDHTAEEDPRLALMSVESGGGTSVPDSGVGAFLQPARNIQSRRADEFRAGRTLSGAAWQVAPGNPTDRDGLGPLYNASSCRSCHIGNGRGHAPEGPDDRADSLIVRLAIPPQVELDRALIDTGDRANTPEPNYGDVLQDRANAGVAREARVAVSYSRVNEEEFRVPNVPDTELRRLELSLENPAYGAFHEELLTSARVAPPLIGMGLIELIPADAILALEDPDDVDQDGISGRVNRVQNPLTGSTRELGRFGWKAQESTVRGQVVRDLGRFVGISSAGLPDSPCRESQSDCRSRPTGGNPELSGRSEDQLSLFARYAGVPQRRDLDDPAVIRGSERFLEAACDACHRPRFVTGEDPDSPELSNQVIYPFSDFLLHDMGPGLADELPEFLADGGEWRTPPLWGLGLTAVVSGDQPAGYLHDGRARNLMEAILWHGGEAQASRDRVAAMSPEQRDDLVRFLESL